MSSTAEYVLSFDALAIMILPTINDTEQTMSSSAQIVSKDRMSYILPWRRVDGRLRYTLAMRFQCQPGCIRCCEQKGFVYVTREDIARLAEHLGITRAEFRRQYLCGTP